MYRDVAQFGRALRSGRRGRRFESCHLDHEGLELLGPSKRERLIAWLQSGVVVYIRCHISYCNSGVGRNVRPMLLVMV